MPAPDYENYEDKLERAAARVDTGATSAQREALNYRQGHLHVHGLEIAIEHPKGSYRTGVGADGKHWKRKMECSYGRIKKTVGRDGEAVDIFMGEHPACQLVFVISQLDAKGNLDEHKCVLGARNLREAKDLYLAHYPEGWADSRVGQIRGYTMDQFKKWLESSSPVKSVTKKAADDTPVSFDDVLASVFDDITKSAAGLPQRPGLLGTVAKALPNLASKIIAPAVTKTPQIAKTVASGAGNYVKSLAGYGEGGSLQGQKLLDSTTVKPYLRPADYAAKLTAGTTPEAMATTHELPSFLGRNVPGVSVVERGLNAVNRTPVLHPVMQASNTLGNLSSTPLTRPLTKPIEQALLTRGAANTQAGGLKSVLGRLQTAAGNTLWAGDAAVGTVGRAAGYGSAGVGAYNAGQRMWNRPADQAKRLLHELPGMDRYADLDTALIDNNPEVKSLQSNPLPAMWDGMTDKSELGELQRAVARRAAPYALGNSAHQAVQNVETDPVAKAVNRLRSLTLGGIGSNMAMRAVANPTEPPIEDIAREELKNRLPGIMANYDVNRNSPTGQRLMRLLAPVAADPRYQGSLAADSGLDEPIRTIRKQMPGALEKRVQWYENPSARYWTVKQHTPGVNLPAVANHDVTRHVASSPAYEDPRNAVMRAGVDALLPPGGQ